MNIPICIYCKLELKAVGALSFYEGYADYDGDLLFRKYECYNRELPPTKVGGFCNSERHKVHTTP
jgi:hypothetical protein